MPKWSHLVLGFKVFLKAVPLFFRYRLYSFAILPILIAIILNTGNELILPTEKIAEANSTIGIFWAWIAITFQTILGILMFALGNFLAPLILTPLFTYYSERCEKLISGKDTPFELFQFLKDVLRAARLSLRNIILYSFWILILYLFTISLLGESGKVIFRLGTFVFSAYFYGFNFLDYSLEIKKLNYHQSISFIKSHKGIALSIGACFSLSTLFPTAANFPFDSLTSMKDMLIWLSRALSPLIGILAATLCMAELEKDSIKISTEATEK